MQQSSARPQPTRYTHPCPQRIACTDCGANYVLRTAILPENFKGTCAKCGSTTESLGPISSN